MWRIGDPLDATAGLAERFVSRQALAILVGVVLIYLWPILAPAIGAEAWILRDVIHINVTGNGVKSMPGIVEAGEGE